MKTICSIISLGLFLTFSSCNNNKNNENGYEKDRINSNTENMHLADSSNMNEPDSAAKSDNTVTGELKDTTQLTTPEKYYGDALQRIKQHEYGHYIQKNKQCDCSKDF